MGRRLPSTANLFTGHPLLTLSASLLMTALIAYADFHTGSSIKPSILYVIPVVFASWYGTRRLGTSLAFLAMVAWVGTDAVLKRDGGSEDVIAILWNSSTRLALFLVIVYLSDRYRYQMREVVSLATTDPLTGLTNRRAFLEHLTAEVARAGRGSRPLALLFLDLDCFKRINDLHGHAAGDEVLHAIGEVLKQRMRTFDLPARLGGDEFAVLLPETTEAAANRVAQDLERRIEAAVSALPYAIGVSIGLAACDAGPPTSAEELLQRADEAMYAVKRRHTAVGQGPRC